MSPRPVAKNGLSSLDMEKTDFWGQQFEAVGRRKGNDLASRKNMIPVIKKAFVPGLDG